MSLQDAVYNTVHDYPGGAGSLAPRMKISTQVLINKANPNNQSNIASLRDADQLMAITGNYAILHALATNHGYVCIKCELDAPVGDLAVLELVTQVWKTNGDVGAAVEATLADRVVERREIKKVRAAIYRNQQAMLAMLARLEDMAEPEATKCA